MGYDENRISDLIDTGLQEKKRLWDMHDKIQALRDKKNILDAVGCTLPREEDLELRNLEIRFNDEYHDYKEREY